MARSSKQYGSSRLRPCGAFAMGVAASTEDHCETGAVCMAKPPPQFKGCCDTLQGGDVPPWRRITAPERQESWC